jgi:hypothetical protein
MPRLLEDSLGVRRYEYRIEWALPLVCAPIFAVHYGGFTAIRGMFVYGLFGEDWLAANNLRASELVIVLMMDEGMVFAVLGLMWMHLQDWRRDVARRGLGADTLLALMSEPYRRVVVLRKQSWPPEETTR